MVPLDTLENAKRVKEVNKVDITHTSVIQWYLQLTFDAIEKAG